MWLNMISIRVDNIGGMALSVCIHLSNGFEIDVSHKFRLILIIIPACLIKQPIGKVSLIYVQTANVSANSET